MAPRRTRLGIIGTGIAARELHWPPLQRQAEHFEIVAVCNHTRPKAERFAEMVGGSPRITTDYRELLRWPEVEAVDIVLPIALNATATLQALRAGKHVIVEKPIAGGVAAGREVVAEARQRPDQVLLVAENMRYEPRVRHARRLLDEGRIGRPVMLHADVLAPLQADSPYTGTGWRQRPEHIGGYLSDGGVHQVAVLQVLAGPITGVQGLVTSFNPSDDVPDTMLANLRFESGAVGHLTYSVGVQRFERTPIRVFGTSGTLHLHHDRITVITADDEHMIATDDTTNGLDGEFADFYACVTTGKHPDVSPEAALRDLQVVDAAIRSMDAGIMLDL